MRCDHRHFAAIVKLIPFLNSFKPAKQPAKSIQPRVFVIVRAGAALKRNPWVVCRHGTG